MIDYLSGNVSSLHADQLVLDVGGIGYLVNISLHTFSKIQDKKSIKLYIHYHVNQQDYVPSLFGFFNEAERHIFKLLISVSGISVNTARIILSTLDPEMVKSAILNEDEHTFRNVKGIGNKTAKRIILDLKDKVDKQAEDYIIPELTVKDNTIRKEALSALSSLQIPRPVAQKAVDFILKNNAGIDSVETLIKLALKQLK